uniref:Retrotransposon, putative, centromere-specific n=2 Tax=Oryza sativa subsp. japonica TaxID=39947 RepID=Q69S11_ORYSJ|nr:hypothetical protein [Oryza sativa Japonica Group]BAD30969.1 hypothetical protein [Oryza sativa Japonica Group]
MDTTVAHIMDQQEDIKIKSSKCWNPIRLPVTLSTSNGRQICKTNSVFSPHLQLRCLGPWPKWGPCGVRPYQVEHDPRDPLVVLPPP